MEKDEPKQPPQRDCPPDVTCIGTTTGKRAVTTEDNAKHIFVCGTTGSGKTVVLSNYIKSGIDKNYPMLIVDGKGDVNEGSILDIIKKLNPPDGTEGHRKVYVINMTAPARSDRYNPFANASPTICKDMLINMTEWSEEHYKLNTERYLQKLIAMLCNANIELSFQNIIAHMPVTQFQALSAELFKNKAISKEEHLQNIDISNACGKIAESSLARFATIAESDMSHIFLNDGIDIYTALQERSIIVFILNPLIYPELSPLMGRLITIDSKKAISKLFNSNKGRTFFILDEINVYASTTLVDLVNKSRSANVTCILATQSLADLDFSCGEAFKEQVIENCNNYIVLRQNSSVNSERWANILGTKSTMEVTYQLKQNGSNTIETGFGSARRVREYIYHPDDIKALRQGNGFFLSRDTGTHCKVSIQKPF